MSIQDVAVLGPAGTFTEQAANTIYPEAKLTYLDSVSEVFDFVQQDRGQGVVAVENNLEGSISETLIGLLESNVYIVGEVLLKIRLALIAPKGVVKKNVKTVLSHPHALAQCQGYLKRELPDALFLGVESTASALKRTTTQEHAAAVAMSQASADYGLYVLEDDIQDRPSQTRFIAIDSRPGQGIAAPTLPPMVSTVARAMTDGALSLFSMIPNGMPFAK